MTASLLICAFLAFEVWLWGHHLRFWRYRKPREIPEFVRQGRPRL